MAGTVEVIVVLEKRAAHNPVSPLSEVAVVSSTGTTRAVLLNDGAAAARGDVLLFLWPDCRLPQDAVVAIGRNFGLLPQSVGGNFHLKFDDDSLFTKMLTRILHKWRYRGRYYGNSGIFVRRDVFAALGGFRDYDILEDYDLARRLETHGPTLYLPNTIIASARSFNHRKFGATACWLTAQTLFSLGLNSDRLARACLNS